MVPVNSSPKPMAPPAYGQAPPPPASYGQPPPPPPTYRQPPPPAYNQAPPPATYGQPPPPAYNHALTPPTGIPVQESPPPLQVQSIVPGPWSTGLCDCCADVPNCCITCWCPCITCGQIAEIVDRGSSSFGACCALYGLINYLTGCACICSCYYRYKMRKQYMLSGHPVLDFLAHFFCEPCALCQEYRELRHRGFDMSLGWHGNVAKQNQGPLMAPSVHGGMTK